MINVFQLINFAIAYLRGKAICLRSSTYGIIVEHSQLSFKALMVHLDVAGLTKLERKMLDSPKFNFDPDMVFHHAYIVKWNCPANGWCMLTKRPRVSSITEMSLHRSFGPGW